MNKSSFKYNYIKHKFITKTQYLKDITCLRAKLLSKILFPIGVLGNVLLCITNLIFLPDTTYVIPKST